jgi:hypothetical protein
MPGAYMPDMTSFIHDERVQKWLDQFASGDRSLAEELLSSLLLVSRDDFNDQLRALILERAAEVDGVVALYAERELRHRLGIPNRLFKESARKPRRAEGSAGHRQLKQRGLTICPWGARASALNYSIRREPAICLITCDHVACSATG